MAKRQSEGEGRARTPHALLLTGAPGVGKTTVIRAVAARLPHARLAGFVTAEVRDAAGRRTGFRAEPFGGESRLIADVGRLGPPRVSRYGVDVPVVERLAESELALREDVDLYLIDEIGKMECLAPAFVQAVTRLLDAGKPVVATIGRRGGGLIEEAKARPDTEVWEVTREDRNTLPDRVVGWLEGRGFVG